MIREYEQGLEFQNYVTEGAHGRTGAFAITDDFDVVREKEKLGWTYDFTQNGFWLRAPDVSLIDITEPFRIYDLGDGSTNLACFRHLKDLKNSCQLSEVIKRIICKQKDKYSGFDFYVSEGQVLEGEIRIGGSDTRIHDLKKDILANITNDKKWRYYLTETKDYLGNVRSIRIRNKSLGQFDQKSIDFINYMNSLNHSLGEKVQPLGMRTVDGLIEQLPNFDVVIFIPTGCYRYMASFLREDVIDRIMLWEIHTDPNQPKTYKLINKDLGDKRCLIVDKSYTGKTLDKMSELVCEKGGIPMKFGLFPKSRCAVRRSDYMLFLDKVFESKKTCITDENWPIKYYKEVLNTD